MKIVPVRLPLKRPFATGADTITVREGFLVFIGDGVGEAMPLPSAGTETLEECRAALETGDHTNAPCARFAVETAFMDAEAKQRGVPIARLLDPAPRSSVPVNAVVHDDEIPPGFSSYKLKVGTPHDLARAKRLRERIGLDAELRLDANGAWSLPTAIEMLRALEPLRPSYCEDPVADPSDAPKLRAHTKIPIAADAWMARPAQLLERRIADVLIIKPAVVGGLLRAHELAHEARLRGMSVVITTMLEGVVGRLAALHLAAAVKTQHAAGLATAELLAADHAEDPAPVRGGLITLPAAPGLGVEVRA